MKKLKQGIISALACLMLTVTAFAEVDNSNLEVEVTKAVGGEQEIIYTGLLGGYDNGVFSSVDFSNAQVVMLIDWNSPENEAIYIVPKSGQNISSNSISKPNTVQNLLNDSSDFEITSQIKINNVNVGEDGIRIVDNAKLNCNFGITNNSNENKEVTAILATYTEDNKLYQVKQSNINISAGNTGNAQMTYQFDAEHEHHAKLMLWDSYSGMFPLRTSIDFSQTSGINAYYYDSDNHLLQIDKADNTSIYFTYDNMGSLLSKRFGGSAE